MTRDDMRPATLVLLAIALVTGCGGGPAATPLEARPDLIRIGGDLDVRLIDTTTLAERLLPVPGNLVGPFQNGVEVVPGQPKDRIIPWVGGDCDVETTLALHRSDLGLVVSIRSVSRIPPGATLCTAGGRIRAVVIRFVGIPPAQITIDEGRS